MMLPVKTPACPASLSVPPCLSSCAEPVPAPADTTAAKSTDAAVAVPAFAEGPLSANLGTAGNADGFAAIPDCAAEHAAVGADSVAAAAAPAAVVVSSSSAATNSACNMVIAGDEGLTDMHQAASCANQMQAGVQVEEEEHGDEEAGRDTEVHQVNGVTG